MILQLLVATTYALKLETTYRTKGLNTVQLDLDQYSEFTTGSTILSIVLDSQLSNSYTYLAYCYTDNIQSIKNILTSLSTIQKHIESNKKLCVFDNNALLYSQDKQQIILTDSIDQSQYSIYNKFSVYQITSRQVTIYLYSPQDSKYTISLFNNQNECLDNCNNNGYCVQNTISYCICNEGYFDSTCQQLSNIAGIRSIVTFQMGQQQSYIFSIPFQRNQKNLNINIKSDNKIILYYTYQYQYDYIPFNGNTQYQQIQIDNGTITIPNSFLDIGQDQVDEIENILQEDINYQLVIVLVNPLTIQNIITMKIYQNNDNQDDSTLQIYYILAGALGALILALIIIIILIYLQRKARRIEQQNRQIPQQQQIKKLSLTAKPRRDYIPVELYEQVLQEYPGLQEIIDCQICLLTFQKSELVKLTYCLHLFHAKCLDEWRRRNQTCPFCREDLTEKKYREHYQEEKIYHLGVVKGDDVLIDEQRVQELEKRQQRIKQLKETSSPQTANAKEQQQATSPSPYSNGGDTVKLFKKL